MFGTLRYILACLVVVAHLGPLPLKYMGYYAVFCFFCLSGYILSRAYMRDYQILPNGYTRYYLNRLTRILPTYFFALGLMLALATSFPEASRYIHPLSQMPDTTAAWLTNLLIVWTPTFTGQLPDAVLLPQSWSLGVELVYWLLLPLAVRYRYLLLFWLGAAVATTGYAYAAGASMETRYFSILSGALPFALGAAICHFNLEKKARCFAPLLIAAAIVFYLVSSFVFTDPFYWGLLLAVVFNSLLVAAFAGIDGNAWNEWQRRTDDCLGHLAYPVFLLHIPAGIILAILIGPPGMMRTPLFLLVGIIATTLLSWLVWRFVEVPVSHLRTKIRKSSSPH